MGYRSHKNNQNQFIPGGHWAGEQNQPPSGPGPYQKQSRDGGNGLGESPFGALPGNGNRWNGYWNGNNHRHQNPRHHGGYQRQQDQPFHQPQSQPQQPHHREEQPQQHHHHHEHHIHISDGISLIQGLHPINRDVPMVDIDDCDSSELSKQIRYFLTKVAGDAGPHTNRVNEYVDMFIEKFPDSRLAAVLSQGNYHEPPQQGNGQRS
ncbi:uncharacterized protein F4822DRAFT_395319 [Hypoxylon trugodes]|uniref:uncharacterized protein n=1 Tax=Hypoxylon trugodes TaxID=326681 RepID=UPI00219F7D4C|nr:uncharacterized protein F4822DRAFT_395319 [Hypoxylon trugodes]KAI1391058.1 hypothetical protein F4822DRAFT_395319 [Hypoxylon trugodes]